MVLGSFITNIQAETRLTKERVSNAEKLVEANKDLIQANIQANKDLIQANKDLIEANKELVEAKAAKNSLEQFLKYAHSEEYSSLRRNRTDDNKE